MAEKPNYKDEQGFEYEWDPEIKGYVPILTESILSNNHDNYTYVPEEYSTDDKGRSTYTDPESKIIYTWLTRQDLEKNENEEFKEIKEASDVKTQEFH